MSNLVIVLEALGAALMVGMFAGIIARDVRWVRRCYRSREGKR